MYCPKPSAELTDLGVTEIENVIQTELICAILSEMDRQFPDVSIDQGMMNTIIRAADAICAAYQGGLLEPVFAPPSASESEP